MATKLLSTDTAKFDYGSVPSSVAKFLQGQAERIRRGCTSSIIQAGKALIEAKRHLSHGAFMRWVLAEVGIPARTAQAYMQVAQWANGKSATVAHLPPSILYLLSARSTPQEFIAKLLTRLEGGECIEIAAARAELKSLRQARRRAGPSATTVDHSSAQRARPPELVSASRPEHGPTMMEAVAVLAHGLSAPDFVEVRAIMTSRSVLDDPNLAQEITAAFLAAGALNGHRSAQQEYIAA